MGGNSLRSRLAICVAAAAILATATSVSVNAGPPPAHNGGATDLGPTPAKQQLVASLNLRLRNRRALIRSVSWEPSGGVRARAKRTLTPRAFGARFGLPSSKLSETRRRLAAHGLQVIESYPQRTAFRIRGTAAAMDRVFSTRIRDRLNADGERFHVPVPAPRVPPWLRSGVASVTGLDTRLRMTPAALSTRGRGYSPDQLASAYDIAPLYSTPLASAVRDRPSRWFPTIRSTLATLARSAAITDCPDQRWSVCRIRRRRNSRRKAAR